MSENNQTVENLTVPKHKALEALVSGATKEQAATVAGRVTRTVDRWINDDPEFRQALQEASKIAISNAAMQLALLLNDAMKALAYVLKSQNTPMHVRLRAVDTVISNLIRLQEYYEIEQEIEGLKLIVNELRRQTKTT